MLGLFSDTVDVPMAGTVATNQTWEPGDAFVIGTGTEFKKLETGPREGVWGGAKMPLVSIDGTDALVCRIDSDSKLTLCKNFEGGKSSGATMMLRTPAPPKSELEKKAAEGVSSLGGRPFYKSPVFIILMIGAGLALTYYLIRRKKGRK